jgi:hypothetical protein
MVWSAWRKKRLRVKMSFQVGNTLILIKRGKIRLRAWFIKGQHFEVYFCEHGVRKGKSAKRDV